MKVPWVRILVEGAVIVASILLALSLDAWWQGRVDHADEIESLRLLDRDLSSTLAQLASFDDRVAAGVDSTNAVLAILSGPRG